MNLNTSLNRAIGKFILTLAGLAFFALGAFPATGQGFAVAFGRQEYLVNPGDVFTGSIPLTNTSEDPVALKIYLADRIRVPGQTSSYTFDEEGGNEPRSLKSWMSFSPERLTLQPDEGRDLTYQINVPDDPTLEGSYWGVIFVESIPSEEPEIVPEDESEIAIGIRTVFRYAVQIYATFEGTEMPEAAFTSLTMEPAADGIDAIAVLENRGNVILRPMAWLELHSTTGEIVYEQEHLTMTLLPESGRDYVFELRDLPVESGEYMVLIYADYGVPTLVAAQGRISLVLEPPGEEDEGEPQETPLDEESEESE